MVSSSHPEDVDEAATRPSTAGRALIVTTTNADKLGIFEGKKLRVFALAADRTQAGRAPILAAQTTSHRWFPVETTIADVDRDGHDDLIVLQSDGMGGGETIVETFFGRGDGGFVTPGRRQKWELRSEGSSYGADLTGDGVAGSRGLRSAGVEHHRGDKGSSARSARPRADPGADRARR